ncbi:MAG: PEP/pyruvate-binding domain-containing protein [Friedmanniella sp.]
MTRCCGPPPNGRGSTSPEPVAREGAAGAVYVQDLAEPAADLGRLGGKAANLVSLTAAGLPVPAGFCVTTAAFVAWRRSSGGAVPEQVAAVVRQAYRALGAGVVAVRSSATAEDLPGLSFAGQQDTVLGVTSEDGVLDALLVCWRSLWTERAVAYRRRSQVDEAGVAMAVVVQRQVAADASGVAFSLDPVSGARGAVVLNVAPGLGEALVAGEAAGTELRVDRVTGAVLPEVPGLLDVGQARRLAELVRRIEELLGTDVDVEWCRSGDELWLVQARPVTASGPVDLWNDSRDGDFLWTNTNVGEAIPDVMTPATWSMVQVFLRDAMATASIPPYVGYGRIGGRVYLNVSVMAALSRAVGVGERRFRALTEEVFGRLPADLEIPPVRVHWWQLMRGLLPMGLHVVSEARREARHLDDSLAHYPALCDQRRAEIAVVADGAQLARLWADTLEPEFHRVSWLLSAATRSSGASFVTTRRRLQRLVGDTAANALTAGLGAQSGDLASLGLLEGLDQLERGQIDPDTFNRRYGHRGPHEFEISRPRPGEDPGWLDRQLAARAGAATVYRDRLRTQEEARDVAWHALVAAHPLQARVLGRALATWGRISRSRERARGEVIRYFWVLRAFVLRAGELTGLGEDVFFLEAAEIIRVLQGETLPPGTIRGRKAAYAAYAALPPYPALIRGHFDPFAWAADPNRRSDLFVAGARQAASAVVRGFPGSAGVVEGLVRVVTDADRSEELRAGEVLVTTVTNVGWTPLFPRAAAVVTDVGAPLSHAAIVARELGIPAVVGCGNATMRLHTGDRVRVDGAAGTVDVLEAAELTTSGS